MRDSQKNIAPETPPREARPGFRFFSPQTQAWIHTYLLPSRELRFETIQKFSFIFGVFLVIVLIGNHAVLTQRQDHEIDALQHQEEEAIDSVQRLIVDRFTTGMYDLLFIQQLPELADYVRNKDAAGLHDIEGDLTGLLKLREDYTKLRIIDRDGMEVLRVHSVDGFPVTVAPDNLQDKHVRPFYRVTLKMKPGEIYVSPFDFNVEHGQIEQPLNPTFRLVSPVFTQNGELACSIVINYFGKKLLRELETHKPDSIQLWVAGEDGSWLKEPGQEFQCDPEHTGRLLAPLGQIHFLSQRQSSGHIMTPNGLFSFKRFNPLAVALDSHPNLKARMRPMSTQQPGDWIIVSQIDPGKLRQMERFSTYINALILFILLAPGALGAWLLSQSLALEKDASRKSKEAREMLEQITDSIPGAVYKLALETNGSGSFLFLSRGAREIFGLERQTAPIRYEDFIALILPEDRPTYNEGIASAFSEDGDWSCEFRIQDGYSCLRWIRASATVRRIDDKSIILSGIFTDITSLKTAEIKRRSSEERLDLALRAANDGLWDWNIAAGATYFSPRWLQMLGYGPNELPHHFDTIKNLIHPEDLPAAMEAFENSIKNKNSHYEMEFRMRTISGKWKWVLSRGAVVQRDVEGRPERFVGTHTDISERKELEKNLKAAKEAAEQANRAKSSFLAIMSHELRTPMNSVCGFSDSLKHTSLDKTQRDYVDKIEKSAGKLLFTINDILDYSKIEADRLDLESISFDFIRNVNETIALLRPQLDEKNLKLEFRVEGRRSLTVKGDPTRIHQIVSNLTANAIKFTDKGVIRIKIISREVDSKHYEIETSVQDSGIGMTPEQQSTLFQPFSQVDNSTTRKYGGTGLGLAICKRLCEMMDGSIRVDSHPGEGSTFTFTLTLERSSGAAHTTILSVPRQPVETHHISAPTGRFDWKVLLADQDEISRKVASELLSEMGCKVVEIGGDGQALTPGLVDGCTAALFDEATMQENGLLGKTRDYVRQSGLKPFYFLGMTEEGSPIALHAETMDAWISKPVDIRNLSRLFTRLSS